LKLETINYLGNHRLLPSHASSKASKTYPFCYNEN